MSDVLGRLQKWVDFDLKVGDRVPGPINWGPTLTADIKDAIAEIERLRSIAGAVSDGPSMADIKARNDRLAEALKHVLSAPLPAWTSGDKP